VEKIKWRLSLSGVTASIRQISCYQGYEFNRVSVLERP